MEPCLGTIAFQLRNDGAHPVTITQVSINDAFWPFTARPSTTITPHGTAFVTAAGWTQGFAPQRQCAGAGTLVAVAPPTGTLV
jgi:hypothetical protein